MAVALYYDYSVRNSIRKWSVSVVDFSVVRVPATRNHVIIHKWTFSFQAPLHHLNYYYYYDDDDDDDDDHYY